MAYQPRTYRRWIKSGDLVSFRVIVEETDCLISANSNLSAKARRSILRYRAALKKYIQSHPLFLTTLEPYIAEKDAPLIAKAMAEAGALAGVGPMAAVAGAIADFVGADLAKFSSELIIENGGDIFLKSEKPRTVGVYAGASPLSGKIGFEIAGGEKATGVSTSSGTVGHSLSFGKADAVVVIARNATLSDAVATAIGNIIFKAADFPRGIEFAQRIPGVLGLLLIKDDQMAAWGQVKLVRTAVSD